MDNRSCTARLVSICGNWILCTGQSALLLISMEAMTLTMGIAKVFSFKQKLLLCNLDKNILYI